MTLKNMIPAIRLEDETRAAISTAEASLYINCTALALRMRIYRGALHGLEVVKFGRLHFVTTDSLRRVLGVPCKAGGAA